MQSLKPSLTVSACASPHDIIYSHSSLFLRGDESNRCNNNNNNNSTRYGDVGELEHPPLSFHQPHAVDLSPSFTHVNTTLTRKFLSTQRRKLGPTNQMGFFYGLKPSNVAFPSSLHSGPLHASNFGVADSGELLVTPVAAGNLEKWGESGMGDTSQHTDTSTDVDTDDRNQYRILQQGAIVVDSADQCKGKMDDQKTLRRLAQNREAARKSRLRKKAYVQQLESSRVKLAQLERELERARQQGIFVASGVSGDQAHPLGGAVVFDTDYARWLEEHQRLINDLRSAMNSHLPDEELRGAVDVVMLHCDELYRLKSLAAKSDVFHMLSGMWKTPAERCFMWLGGFRSSELLKILGSHMEPLTEQQLMGICNLQQSSQQAEDALSQGMEALQQSLLETLSSDCIGPSSSGNVADYMGQMAIAMGKLTTLENFVHQADLLRQQTLHQLHRILTIRQAARALLVMHDYTSRLRALSSLWLARPKS